MTRLFKTMMMGASALILSAAAVSAENLVIATFGDPTPMNAFRATKEFEKATGWTIEWRVFAVSALVSSCTTCCWPTISVKLRGRYLRASTR